MISRIAIKSDIEGILNLQDKNLVSNLTAEQKNDNGFVTTPFTSELLTQIIELKGAYVTVEDEKVIAYLIGGPWPFYDQWPIFTYMTSRFPGLKFQNWAITRTNSFQYGPVCIDANHRGKGVIKEIFEAMRIDFKKQFPLAVTFINQANLVSTKAHLKIGWTIIDEFDYNDNQYYTLILEL